MGDYQILMQFDIAADPATVHRAIATEDGIRSWWSKRTDGPTDAAADGGATHRGRLSRGGARRRGSASPSPTSRSRSSSRSRGTTTPGSSG